MADPNFNFRRPKRISQFLGFLYMWITYFVGIQIQRFKHDDPQVIILLILFFLLTPLFLTAVYSWVYPTRWKLTLYITAFPGCLALILQYVLMSFIPYQTVEKPPSEAVVFDRKKECLSGGAGERSRRNFGWIGVEFGSRRRVDFISGWRSI